jgi:hypothetical protein
VAQNATDVKLRNAHLAVVDRGKVLDAWREIRCRRLVSAHTQESRQWSVRTVWIIDRGGDAPGLVTAYPGKE